MRQRPAQLLAVAFAAVLIALASAAPAGAHAVLVETQPANGTVLETWPDRVLLRFNEPVDASLGALRVYDSDAERVDSGRTSRPDAQTVAIELGDRPLARGTYTVAWRIVSADSHPLHGAFVFSVKSKSDTTGVIDQLLEDDEVPREVSVGFTVTRFLSFALLLACVGGAIALFAIFRGIETQVRPTLRLVLGVLAAVLAVASLVGIVFHGASAGGFGLGDALSWDVFTAVLDTRFGEVWLVRAGLAAGLALVAFSGVHPGFLLPFAVGLAWTLPAAGHANTAGALAFAMDLLHVLAASVWAGGLTFVLLALILARTESVVVGGRDRAEVLGARCRLGRRAARGWPRQRLPRGACLERALGDELRSPAAGQVGDRPRAARNRCLQQPASRAAAQETGSLGGRAAAIPRRRGHRAGAVRGRDRRHGSARRGAAGQGDGRSFGAGRRVPRSSVRTS